MDSSIIAPVHALVMDCSSQSVCCSVDHLHCTSPRSSLDISIYTLTQNKLTQRQSRDICLAQEYFYTEFSLFTHEITQDKSETYTQFLTGLMSLFDYYLESRKIGQSY